MITGDLTQVDLPSGTSSGLSEAVDILSTVKGIGLMRFSRADVVRHPLVQSIIEAYEKRGDGGRQKKPERSSAPSS